MYEWHNFYLHAERSLRRKSCRRYCYLDRNELTLWEAHSPEVRYLGNYSCLYQMSTKKKRERKIKREEKKKNEKEKRRKKEREIIILIRLERYSQNYVPQ